MKGKIKTITKKVFALVMATAMSIPAPAFASDNQIKIYEQDSSVMGIRENSETNKEIIPTEDNSYQIENDHIKMEVKSRLESLDKIIYEIKISKKNTGDKVDQEINLNLTPNPNSSINKVKLQQAKALSPEGEKEIDFEEIEKTTDLKGLNLRGKIKDEIILEAAADIREAKDDRTYDMLVSLDDGKENLNLKTNFISQKEITKENDKEVEKTSLKVNDKKTDNLKGQIEAGDLFKLFSTKETILWTDYLANDTKESENLSYEFKLDDKQDTKDTKISLDYYENSNEGYILKKEFSQSIDFSNKIEFEIPAGYIAKLSLKTKVDKNNPDVKAYSLNGRQVKNPSYKDKKDGGANDDEEGSAADSEKQEKPIQTGTEKQDKKEDQDTKIDDTNEEVEKESDTEITVTDSNGEEVPVEVKEKDSNKENKANEISALILNKDSLISRLKAENKLDATKEEVITNLAENLNSYNEEKISDQDLKNFTRAQATNTNIDKADLRFFIESILSGLNKQTNKVANLNIDEIIDYAYPEKTDEKSDEKTEGKNLEDLSPDELAAKKLAEEGITIEDFQNFMYELEEKYGLTDEDAARIYSANNEAIEALVKKAQDEKTTGDIFAVNNNFKDKKFTIIAPITLSTITGPIQTSQKITLKLDEKLTVKDGTTIEPLKNDKEKVIANGRYDKASNSIIYTFTAPVREKTTVKINQEVDFNLEKIGEATEITVQNSLTAPGMASAKNFPEVTVKDTDSNPSSQTKIDSGDMEMEFITELEYFTETLTRATNEGKLFEIVRSNTTENLSDQQIRSDYVGWKINIPGIDKSGMDIREISKDKYDYTNLNFSLYAPAGQSLEDYKVVVEDGQGGKTTYSGSMTEKIGDHYVYSFSVPKANLTDKGYNIYVVAKAPKKRQNYAVGLKIEPDNNYVLSILKKFEEKFEEFAKGNPFVYKWKDTTAANPYANGIELLDTRMVYIEPNGWQDLFPYNEFKSVDYNDNIDDTDIMKNTVSMFGNIDENGNITWTISETFPAEKLENKNTVGRDAYSAKTDGQGLTGPSVQILVPNKTGGYDAKNLGNISNSELQNQIGNRPGTIVNYTFTDKAKDKEEFTTLSLDSGKKASIAYKPSLLQRDEGAEKDTTGLAYLHKVQEHKDGPGYEIALSNDQAHTMKAFIPSDLSANPRYNDPAFKDTGVVVFCLNPGKPEPTRQYKFNGTITKGEWSTAEKDWAENGRAIAALATASEAKSSPLYKGQSNGAFYASLYEHLLRMYWYGQEMAEEYQLDEQSYYKIIQYNLYYWLAGDNYAESFRNGGGYNPKYFSSAEYSYAQELKNRIEKGKDWDKVDKDEEIQFFYYGHDKSRSYQNTITGDTKKPVEKGSVTVNKIDQDGKKLPGAAFQLLDKDQKPIKTLVTDANGVAIFEDLEYGTYYIKEVQAPKGYQFSDQQTKVEVGEEKAHVTFNYTNTKNEIEFRKVDENGLAMSNVVFELRRNGRPLSDQDQTSDEDGKFSWKELTPGYYEVVEKDISKYPKYSENQGRVVASFRVDENNKIQDKKIYYPNGSSTTDIVNKQNEGKPIGIEFTKVDLKTDKALEGAEFVLEYRKPETSIFRELPGSRRRSNRDGKLVWNNLVDGDYRVIETKAPDGNYDTDLNLGEKATFTIEKNQNGYYEITKKTPLDLKITNKEKPEEPKEYFGEFEFTKVDSEDKKPLQGVEFTLTSDAPVGPEKDKFDYKVSKTTGEDGKIKYTKLYPGTYTLKETKQLPGYKENTKTYKVVVANDGKTSIPDLENNKYELEFTNNDTALRNTSYAYIKETLEQNPNNPNGMIYKITIKPKRELNQVVLGFDRWSGLSSYGLEQNSYIRKSSLPAVGEEKTFTYYISIEDIETFKKNTPTSPIGSIQVWYDEIGNYQSVGSKPTFTLKSNSESSGLTITNDKEKPKPASLTIKKVDSKTKEGLEGAKFRLYRTEDDARNDRSYLQEVESNEHGYAIFDSPEIQNNTTYYVKEIAAPDGYKITSEITAVKSSATEDNTINAEIPNEKNNARFEIYKKDSDGKYLEGAVFTLLNSNKEKVQEQTTDSNGYVKFDNLESNTVYYLVETKAPDGYNKKTGQVRLTVDKDGNISWGDNSLIEEKYTGPNITEIEGPGMQWRTTEDHKWARDPSYLNTREYAELVDPKTGEINYYVMLKAFDYKGNGTNTSTNLQLSTKNATIKKVELYEADFYKLEVKSRVAQAMKDGTIANNTDLKLANAANRTAGDITMYGNTQSPVVTNTLSFTNAADRVNINFPYNKQKNAGRFDINWAYVAKVTAKVVNKQQAARVQYHWNNSSDPSIYIENYQEVPAIRPASKETIVEPPTFTVINQKKPSITFEKQDGASKKGLYGAEFVLYKDGTEVTNSLTSSDKEGKFGFDNLEDGSYTVYETASPEGYPYLEEKIVVASFTVKDGKITKLTTNQEYGEETIEEFDPNKAYPIYNKINEIKFKKIGKDKQALEGAKFKLDRVWDSYDDNGKLQSHRETVLENIETLDDGIIALSATKAGRYQLVETQAPDGYKTIKTDNDEKGQIVAEFTVARGTLDIKNITVGNNYYQNLDEVTQPIEIVNKEAGKGKFQVNKVEKDGNTTSPLIGAKFLLKNIESGQYVKTDGTFTTSSGDALTNGSTVNYDNLPVGEYELREFKAPDGYVRTINTWKVVVDADGKTTIALIDNFETNTPTAVRVKEKERLESKIKVEIYSSDGTINTPANLTLVNKPNEIEFTKIDSKTEKALEGVEFEIWWDQQGKRNDEGVKYKEYVQIKNSDGGTTFKTDAQGKFKLKNLGTGHYKIYEVKVPEGYKVEDKPVDNEPIRDAKGEFVNEFFVDIDGDIKKNDKGIVGGDDDVLVTKIKNTPIRAKFRVQKVGENGVEKLDGASFELYKMVNGEADKKNPIKQEVVKDSDGKDITGLIEFADLEDGEYLLEETKAPDGYSLSKAKWNVSVNEGRVNITATEGNVSTTRTDDTLTLNVVNKKAQGEFKLIKVDEEDKKLAGAKFKLTGVTDTSFSKEVESDEKGEIIFRDLETGTYILEETKPAKGFVPTKIKWNVVVDNDGKTTITVKPNKQAAFYIRNNSILDTAYASEVDGRLNFIFIVENVKDRSEDLVSSFNGQLEGIASNLEKKYGDKAYITVISNENGQQYVAKEPTPAGQAKDFKLQQSQVKDTAENGHLYGGHLDNAVEKARQVSPKFDSNHLIIMEDKAPNWWLLAYNDGGSDKGTIVDTDKIESVTMLLDQENLNLDNYYDVLVNLGISEEDVKNSDNISKLSNTLAASIPVYKEALDYKDNGAETQPGRDGGSDQNPETGDININPSEIDDLSNNQEKLKELNNQGYLIANVTTNSEDTSGDSTDGKNISTIKVVNKKVVYPMTGGPGVWIGFTILGLILMSLAGFYYNIKKKYGQN